MKPSEQNYILYRSEKFKSFGQACSAYGLNLRYAHKFLQQADKVTAIDQALKFRDMRLFYGLVIYPHKILGLINPSDSSDVERVIRIINVYKNATAEQINREQHLIVKNNFNYFIKNIKKSVDNKKLN